MVEQINIWSSIEIDRLKSKTRNTNNLLLLQFQTCKELWLSQVIIYLLRNKKTAIYKYLIDLENSLAIEVDFDKTSISVINAQA